MSMLCLLCDQQGRICYYTVLELETYEHATLQLGQETMDVVGQHDNTVGSLLFRCFSSLPAYLDALY